MGESEGQHQEEEASTAASKNDSSTAAVAVNNQAKDEEKMIQQVANYNPPKEEAPPKEDAEEAEGQKKPKTVDLTLSTSSATTRQGRRPRHQRNTKAATHKLAELELKSSTTSHVEMDHHNQSQLLSSSVTSTSGVASPPASRPITTSNSIMVKSSSTSQAVTHQSIEIMVEEEETKDCEDHHMPETFSSSTSNSPQESSSPALEPSMIREPSQSFITTYTSTAHSPQPVPYDRAEASTYHMPCDKKAVRPHAGSGGDVGYPLPSLEPTPGAVSAPGRAFGALRRQDP
jgi:hypothetical protein